jgi:hypothetical protein
VIGNRAMSVSIGENGTTLYAHKDDVLRTPASNEKLMLTMAILDQLGPNQRIETRAAAGSFSHGEVSGPLWILGGGDPGINSARLGTLAHDLVHAGLTRVDGPVRGSTTFFKHDWFAKGWKRDFPQTECALPSALIPTLAALHTRIIDSGLSWATKLEGTYFPQQVLRRYAPSDALYPSVNEARFYMGGHGSDWVIQSHILREQGIVLAGPAPRSLIDPVAPDDLRRAMRELLRGWWAPMLHDSVRLRSNEYQAYAILTMCRALYTLETGAIASKPVAARWAQAALGERRSAPIERALAWRPGMPLDMLDETLDFIQYTLLFKKCGNSSARP